MTQPQGATSGATDFEAATAWRASQVEEYSQWVAAGDIYHGNALAYTKGMPVPASNVIAHNYDAAGLVERPAGWSDPVPGDGIEDAEPVAEPVAVAPSTSDGAPENVAVRRTARTKGSETQ